MVRISSVTINNKTIPIGKLTVLVGPNNVGKSQFLKDIMSVMTDGRSSKTILIKSIEFESPNNFESFTSNLMVDDNPSDVRYYEVSGLLPSLLEGTKLSAYKDAVDKSFSIDQVLGNLTKLKISYLDASSRLNISKTASTSSPNLYPQNPLQGLFRLGKETQVEIREIFRRAFDMDILLDYTELQNLKFRVSSNFPDIPSHPFDAFPILKEYPSLDDQGDGFKSLVGIVIGFILSKERIILLDEPEAFLHPKQSRILGNWIANYSLKTNNQIIISSHSGSFLAGILSERTDVDIFRMNRKDNITELFLLSSDNLNKLSNSPLLSGQPIFESLFHEGVIVCEGDADRCLYQTVAVRHLRNDSIFFVHSHNKQTVKDVVQLMRNSAVPVAAIVDIDILNSSDDLCNLLNTLNPGGDFAEILTTRTQISNEVEGRGEDAILAEMTKELGNLILEIQNNHIFLSRARSKLDNIFRRAGKWNELKSKGISILSEPQKKNATRLMELCKSYGLFIVYTGELESWIDSGIGKRNKGKWIVKAIEILNEKCPGHLNDFVKEVLTYLQRDIQSETQKLS